MAKSLAEQLLKAGLVDAKKAKTVKKEQYDSQKHARKHKLETVDEAKAAAEAARQQKLERDRELNRQIKEEAERKAVIAQIRQLIDSNKVDRRRETLGVDAVEADGCRDFQIGGGAGAGGNDRIHL